MPVQFQHSSIAKTSKQTFAGDNQFLTVAVGTAAFAEIGLTELPASYPTLMTVTVNSRSLLISDAAQGISRRALQSQLGYSPAANCALRLDRLPNLVVAPSL